MGKSTSISWCRSSWSPWLGCTKVSPGCDNCYARVLDARHRYGGAAHWGAGVPRYRSLHWERILRWDNACKMERDTGLVRVQDREDWTMPGFWPVFPSLCDPFDNEIDPAWRSDFIALAYDTPNLTWLWLTKRIGNVPRLMEECTEPGKRWKLPPNVWLGASIVNQEEADRDLPRLLRIPAAKRFVSYEPALGRVDFCATFGMWWNQTMGCFEGDGPMINRRGREGLAKPGIDQVIVGGESSQGGAKARPFDIEWARSTVRQCKAAGVAAFVKQVGSAPFDTSWPEWDGKLKDRAGADPAEWPADLRVQEFPSTQRETAACLPEQ